MNTTKTPEPVLIANAILMTLHTFFAGGVIVQGFIKQNTSLAMLFAFGNLATVALQAGLTAYQRGVVVPVTSVVERVNSDGVVIAGPANTVVEPGTAVRGVNETPEAERRLAAMMDSAIVEQESTHIYPVSRTEQDGPL